MPKTLKTLSMNPARERYPFLISVLLMFLLLIHADLWASEGYYFVEHVIDGDTVVIENGEKVRYIGMDTPEVGEPFYNEAKKRNIGLVGGRRVRLVFCDARKRDKYGRLLAWVYTDGVFVNETLVKEGLARRLQIPPCGLEKAAEFERAEKDARGKKLGLWAPGVEERYRETLKTITPEEALRHAGERVNVRGTVKNAKKTRDAVFLDFNGKDGFSAVIFKRTLEEFKSAGVDPMKFKGRTVTVTGEVKMYRERAEIVVKKPEDLKRN